MNISKVFLSILVGIVAGGLAYIIGVLAHLGVVVELDVAIGVVAGIAFYVWGNRV